MTGREINQLRNALGLNPIQFAAAVGVSPATVYRWESSETRTRQISLDPMQYELMTKAKAELDARGPVAAKSIGDDIVKAFLFGGALYATYLLMQELFDPKKKAKKK